MSDSDDDKKKKQTSPPPKNSSQPWWVILLYVLFGIFVGCLILFAVYRSEFGKSSNDSKYDIGWDEYIRRENMSKREQ